MRKITLKNIFKAIFAKKNRLFLYLFFIIGFVGFLSAYANKWSSSQSINKIIISGNTIIPSVELLSSIDTSVIHNIRKNVDLIKIKSQIISHPYVLTTYVMLKKSSVLEIEVNERFPCAIVTKRDGEICFADETGNILPYRLSLKFGELPILRGIYNSLKPNKKALINGLKIIKCLNDENNFKVNNLVSEIIYIYKSDSYNILTSDKAFLIRFGKSESVEQKISLLSDFFETKISAYNVNDIEYLDVRWKDRIIVKCREA